MKLTALEMGWIRQDLDEIRRVNTKDGGPFASVIDSRLDHLFRRLFPVVEVEVEAEVPDDGVYRG